MGVNHDTIERFRRGDEKAFKTLIDALYKRFLSVALDYELGYENSEEILSDVLLKLWDNREKIATVNHFRRWGYMAIRNLCIDIIRKESKKKIKFNRYADYIESLGEEYPEYCVSQISYKMQKLIDRLTPTEKLMVNEFYFEGKTLDEVAKDTERAKPTVKHLLYVAREKLKKYTANEKEIL